MKKHFRKFNVRLVTTILASAFSVGTLAADLTSKPQIPPDIEDIVSKAADAYLADPEPAAISIGVVRGDQIMRFHFGTLIKGEMKKPDDTTLYPIASITKTFTGTLMAQAAIEHKLEINDDVAKYLDGDYANLAYDGEPVRLFHLLNHRSGLPFILPNPPEAAPDFKSAVAYPDRINNIVGQSSREDFYAALHQVKLTATPGIHYQYSNAAAQLAGYVLEKSYQVSFEDLLRTKITRPLAMNDTVITLNADQAKRLATGYDERGQKQVKWSDKFQAAAAVKSTLPDMLRYAKWQLEERDPAVILAHKPTFTDDDFSIGLNWQILTLKGHRVIFQDGATPGYASLCILEPDIDLALVIMSNELGPKTLGRLSAMANQIIVGIDARSVPKP